MRLFGTENLRDDEVDVGEGFTEPGTIVFPGDAQKQLGIIWKDRSGKRNPDSARTLSVWKGEGENVILVSRGSDWLGAGGITIGTSLKRIERINRRPFRIAGFGWDYSGTVMSWRNGTLASGAGCAFVPRLQPSEPDYPLATGVLGDGTYSSGHPAMQRSNPKVYEVILLFGQDTKR